MQRTRLGGCLPAALAVGILLNGFDGTVARSETKASVDSGFTGALAGSARVEVVDLSGEILRSVNGTLLPDGVVVQTSALVGATRVRVQSREGESWESDTVISAHPLIGLSLLDLSPRPSKPVAFPADGSYRAKMRVWLCNGPGVGPDTMSARIYENFKLRDLPDLCPIDAGIVGAAVAVDSTGRFLGVACDLSEGPYKFGYIVPAGSVAQLVNYRMPPRSVASPVPPARVGFAEDTTATGLLFRGAVLTQIGQLDEARRLLHLAEERDVSLVEIYDWAGRALFAQEQYEQAAEEFQYATRQDSTNYRVWHKAGEALHMAADLPGAERMYRKAIQLKPDAAETYCTLGVTYLKMERGREAEEAWRTSIRIDPRFQGGVAYYNLASKMKHGGRAAAVDSICAELAEVDPSWAQRLREAWEKSHH
jgi:Flp pilus assembly protein TadD